MQHKLVARIKQRIVTLQFSVIQTIHLNNQFESFALVLLFYLFIFFWQAGALVHVYTDGSVLVTHGGTEMGQGLHTKMVQVRKHPSGEPDS